MSPTPRLGHRLLPGALLLTLALTASGCYGPKRITYVDSSRRMPKQERVVTDPSQCPAGVARIETSSGWMDSFIEAISYSMCAGGRNVTYVCAEEP